MEGPITTNYVGSDELEFIATLASVSSLPITSKVRDWCFPGQRGDAITIDAHWLFIHLDIKSHKFSSSALSNVTSSGTDIFNYFLKPVLTTGMFTSEPRR